MKHLIGNGIELKLVKDYIMKNPSGNSFLIFSGSDGSDWVYVLGYYYKCLELIDWSIYKI